VPPRDVDKLQQEIEELFADLSQVPRFSASRHGFRPSADCFRTTDPPALTVVVELPGVDPASVRVVVGERLLAVAGMRERPPAPRPVYQQMEIAYGPFQRQIRLAEDVDPERALARLENGVLTVFLPIVEPPQRLGRFQLTIERRP
jgi:HSP20 family protein